MDRNKWTDEHFDQMNWHDCPIYGISFQERFTLVMDIDYIFEWVNKVKQFQFSVAPCTLIFENVYDYKMEADTFEVLEIDEITRSNPQRPKNAEYIKRDVEYDWEIHLHQGIMTFKSVGFKLYVRKEPILCRQQRFPEHLRGAINFERLEF